jgi:hypothetical protein
VDACQRSWHLLSSPTWIIPEAAKLEPNFAANMFVKMTKFWGVYGIIFHSTLPAREC